MANNTLMLALAAGAGYLLLHKGTPLRSAASNPYQAPAQPTVTPSIPAPSATSGGTGFDTGAFLGGLFSAAGSLGSAALRGGPSSGAYPSAGDTGAAYDLPTDGGYQDVGPGTAGSDDAAYFGGAGSSDFGDGLTDYSSDF